MSTRRTHRYTRGGESGQAMVLFALIVAAMMGMLAVVIDLGFLSGQRRFDQNGADAAAFAVAQALTGYVEPGPNGTAYFNKPDASLYAIARSYAGMAADTGVTVPLGGASAVNQPGGLASRNTLAVTLEYNDGTGWCYSPSGPAPRRYLPSGASYRDPSSTPAGAELRCDAAGAPGMVSGTGGPYPPRPTGSGAYKVRVTVSSTTDGFFTRVINSNNGTPPPATDDATPACIRPQTKPAGAAYGTAWTAQTVPGNTTCAQAVVAISGSAGAVPAGRVIPFTTADCNLTSTPGDFYVLWSGHATNCSGGPMGSFKNYLDLSAESTWCDGTGYDYSFNPNHWPSPCQGSMSPDPSWNRSGYSADPSYPGENGAMADVAWWVSTGGFGGTVRADTCTTGPGGATCTADGNRFPDYPNGGDFGSNLSDPLYCRPGSVTGGGNGCSTSVNASGTYFFARNKLLGSADATGRLICPDDWGRANNYGCRDTGVITWAEPQKESGSNWNAANNNPVRVRAKRVLSFRLYCTYDASGNCTGQPAGVSTSNVSGRWVSYLGSGSAPCPTCAPVGAGVNYVSLVS